MITRISLQCMYLLERFFCIGCFNVHEGPEKAIAFDYTHIFKTFELLHEFGHTLSPFSLKDIYKLFFSSNS